MVSVREAIERLSLDDFVESLAPDVVWIGIWPGQLCRNRDDVVEMFARAREQELKLHPTIVAEQEDVFVVDPQLDGRHHVILLDEGLVSEVRVYPDRRSALGAVEGMSR
jgi:hypothetical protein